MHELSIASSIVEAVRGASRGCRVTGAGLVVGELSGVDVEALRFSLEALTTGTDLEGVPVSIDLRPRSNRCLACGHIFPVLAYNLDCPACGSPRTEPAGGTELELAWVEIEDT